MNPITILIGLAFSGYGFMVLRFRLQGKDEKFSKLGLLREKFGEKAGSLVHYIGNGIVPLILGGWFIIAGIKGIEVFKVFK
ncbi:MAG: hypothetical protein GXY86_07530 [Firmicutes bacterium]|nr:hypothetical protein [Bacillota bacterium]